MKHEPPSTSPLSLVVVDRQRKHRVKKDEIEKILQRAAAALNVTGELALVFGGDALLRRLNRDYRFKDKPTDVLSFESHDQDMGLGDIIISVETARANAVRFGRKVGCLVPTGPQRPDYRRGLQTELRQPEADRTSRIAV